MTAWLKQKERGVGFLIRLTAQLTVLLGRAPLRSLVRCIALFYAWRDEDARRASRQWLTRIQTQGDADADPKVREVSFVQVYRHLCHFAQVTLDRLFLLKGQGHRFQFTRNGNEYLIALHKQNRGAMLLGAHLGSFDAMRAGGKDEDFPVHFVGHFNNAKMITAVLEQLAPSLKGRFVEIGDDPIGLALTLREHIEQGHFLAILADRTGLNEKTVVVDFLGAPAAFPAGPFLLASALKCPVLLVFALYVEPNRYELFCEPFAERIVLPRKNRAQALQEIVQQYAGALESYARLAPNNWFNFYDFWEVRE